MNRKRLLSLLVIGLLLLVGLPVWFFWREYRQECLNRDLIAAIWRVNPDRVKVLLDQGANVNAADIPGEPIRLSQFLQRLLTSWRHQPVQTNVSSGSLALKLIFDEFERSENQDGETQGPKRQRPLGYDTIAAMLVSHGANTEIGSEDDELPLHFAAAWGLDQTALALLSRSTDVNARDEDGSTPLMGADKECTELLLQHGADLNAKDESGRTALFYAEADNAKLLIAHGADLSQSDKFQCTPLLSAIKESSPQMIETLLNSGADPNQTGLYGLGANVRIGTAIQQAAVWEREDLVMMLLKHGARINFRDDNGDTALGMAIHYRNNRMIHLLKAHGAHE